MVGPATVQGEWEVAIDRVEPFYVVMGMAPSRDGVAFVGRASQQHVVNVAKQGGMCAVMVSAKALDGVAASS